MWAVAGSLLDHAVHGSGRRALIVVELQRRQVLALQSVPGGRASAVLALLERLVRQHGPPLVLKAGNGTSFLAPCVSRLCPRHSITLMHSPVRRPRWNGTCEASGRWAKERAQAAALRRSGVTLTQQDLDAAVTLDGSLPVLAAELRSRFQSAYDEQLADLARERGLADQDRAKIICSARWVEWLPSALSRSATSSPSKVVCIASGYRLRHRDKKAGCTAWTELPRQAPSEDWQRFFDAIRKGERPLPPRVYRGPKY
ncbi:MAG: hypothetical protein IT458_03595 [Planctomycetes bacterium]|nr:hypothetical protein [Planctomycetota bacterium]